MIDLEKTLIDVKRLAVEAGKSIMKVYNSDFKVEFKEDNSPLTKADKLSNKIITSGLRNLYPSFAILSEEEKEGDKTTRLNNPWCFVVDPLDGTKEFIKRNGQFTVNIALSYKNESILGVIYVPSTADLYYASKGNGSFLEDGDGRISKLRVSPIEKLDELRIVMSNSHGCKEMDNMLARYQFSEFIQMGSSLKGCIIAKGDAELYYRFNPTMEWDTAAMQCIVEEAGGFFRQMDGSPMLYNRVNSLNDKGFYIVNSLKNTLI